MTPSRLMNAEARILRMGFLLEYGFDANTTNERWARKSRPIFLSNRRFRNSRRQARADLHVVGRRLAFALLEQILEAQHEHGPFCRAVRIGLFVGSPPGMREVDEGLSFFFPQIERDLRVRPFVH